MDGLQVFPNPGTFHRMEIKDIFYYSASSFCYANAHSNVISISTAIKANTKMNDINI